MDETIQAATLEFYEQAHDFVDEHENMKEELRWSESLDFEKVDPSQFFREYVWAVLCSGMKVTVARMMEKRLYARGFNPEAIGHPAKRRALQQAWKEYPKWFEHLKSLKGQPQEQIEYLDSLPHIGPVTRYHLAQNLGLEFAKPDVHLQRLADRFGYPDVQKMCEFIAAFTGERIRTVDLVLWRYLSEHPDLSRGMVG